MAKAETESCFLNYFWLSHYKKFTDIKLVQGLKVILGIPSERGFNLLIYFYFLQKWNWLNYFWMHEETPLGWEWPFLDVNEAVMYNFVHGLLSHSWTATECSPWEREQQKHKGDVSGLFRTWSWNDSHSNLTSHTVLSPLKMFFFTKWINKLLHMFLWHCNFFPFYIALKRSLMSILLVYVH